MTCIIGSEAFSITDAIHCTKFHSEFSYFLNILASVIQGRPVIGHAASYAIDAGDMRPITDGNDMVKYADDTYLVVLEVNSASCEDELKHIDQWATDNNLRLNQATCFTPEVAIVPKKNYHHHCPEFNALAASKFLALLSVITC